VQTCTVTGGCQLTCGRSRCSVVDSMPTLHSAALSHLPHLPADVYCDRRLPADVRAHEVLLGECLGGALAVNDFLRLAHQVRSSCASMPASMPAVCFCLSATLDTCANGVVCQVWFAAARCCHAGRVWVARMRAALLCVLRHAELPHASRRLHMHTERPIYNKQRWIFVCRVLRCMQLGCAAFLCVPCRAQLLLVW
jgi:hypothetical protein